MIAKVTLKEAKEGMETLGSWMEFRYHIRFIGVPIQEWDMPGKEKGFFTCYAMNIALESDGFKCLAGQKPQDVDAFVKILGKIGAVKTSVLVKNTIAALRTKTPSDEDQCTSRYYAIFKREKVWLRLMRYVGRTIYMRYFLRAQKLHEAGKNINSPKEWRKME